MCLKLTEGFWGFLGVLMGGIISIVSQYFFAKSNAKAESKRILAGKMMEIAVYTENVKNAVAVLINFSKINLDEIESADPVKDDLQRFIPKCVSQWPDYFCLLNWHFKNIVKQKRFTAFINIMEYLSIYEKGLHDFLMPAYDVEILKNQQDVIKGYVPELEITKKINGLVREEYFKIFRG